MYISLTYIVASKWYQSFCKGGVGMTSASNRTARVGTRVPAHVKALLQRAADLSGRSLTDFIIASAQASAEETIRQHTVVQLSAEDSRRLAQALLNPPAPNVELREAFADYRSLTGQPS